MENIKIYTVHKIMSELETCIDMKLPFSLIRLGDGGLKFIDSVINNDIQQMKEISNKEGIPLDKFVDIFELWGYYLRRANFIDTCDVYFNQKFWPRLKNKTSSATRKTIYKMKKWKELYENAEIEHERFCNPEINYLSCLENKEKNLLKVIENKTVCFISTYYISTLKKHIKICNYIDNIKIVGQYGNQYRNNYFDVISKLKEVSNYYDIILVAAGELGRIYSGVIKENGGRAFDIGFMLDFWCTNKKLHPRLQRFLSPIGNSNLHLQLTNEGRKYNSFI